MNLYYVKNNIVVYSYFQDITEILSRIIKKKNIRVFKQAA